LKLIAIAPAGQAELFPVLEKFFPHKRFNALILTEYVAQLLHISTYMPSLQSRVLNLIISKALEIDVEIVIEDSGEVRIENSCEDDLFELDEDFDDGNPSIPTATKASKPSSSAKYATMNTEQRIPVEVAEMADKLDSILITLIHFVEAEFPKSPEIQDRLYQQLLSIFEGQILSTHKSKFVQFIIFHASTKEDRFADAFIQRLISIFLDETHTPIKRQSAVAYLASYLSRYKFLNIQKTRFVIESFHRDC